MVQIAAPTIDMPEVQTTAVRSVIARVEEAKKLHRKDRAAGLAALNEIFRTGTIPDPAVDGRTAGELVALHVAPGLTQLTEAIIGQWLPWKGKVFNAGNTRGDNIFTRDSYGLIRLTNPLYRGIRGDTDKTYRAFDFRTYVGPGKDDPDIQVLKLDYNIPENPRITIRRVLDELVQVDENYYLGKAHLHWWWGTWTMVAFFALRVSSNK